MSRNTSVMLVIHLYEVDVVETKLPVYVTGLDTFIVLIHANHLLVCGICVEEQYVYFSPCQGQ